MNRATLLAASLALATMLLTSAMPAAKALEPDRCTNTGTLLLVNSQYNCYKDEVKGGNWACENDGVLISIYSTWCGDGGVLMVCIDEYCQCVKAVCKGTYYDTPKVGHVEVTLPEVAASLPMMRECPGGQRACYAPESCGEPATLAIRVGDRCYVATP